MIYALSSHYLPPQWKLRHLVGRPHLWPGRVHIWLGGTNTRATSSELVRTCCGLLHVYMARTCGHLHVSVVCLLELLLAFAFICTGRVATCGIIVTSQHGDISLLHTRTCPLAKLGDGPDVALDLLHLQRASCHLQSCRAYLFTSMHRLC